MEEILKDFLAETTEGLLAAEQQMLLLEKEPDNLELVHGIFRVLHSIKGTCGFLGLNRLQQIAHSSENIFGQVRDQTLELDEDTLSILFEAIDKIKEIITDLGNGEPEGDADADEILKLRLDTCARKQKSAAKTVIHQSSVPDVATKAEEPVLEENTAAEEITTDIVDTQYLPPVDTVDVECEPEIMADITVDETPAVIIESVEVKPSDEQLMPVSVLNNVNSIRLDMQFVEHLVDLAGEMVLLRNQLLQVGKNSKDGILHTLLSNLNANVSKLQEVIMKTRLQPIETIWQNIPRQVRDLCKALDKKVNVTMLGQDTEVDRQVLNLIKDPIMHMIYNAIDHGIETVEARVQSHKSEEGTITLKACYESGYVRVEVIDDGKGIDIENVKYTVIDKGLATVDELKKMDESQVLKFIFSPGFSTAQTVSTLSGRGVGLNVVKANLEKIGGIIFVDSQPGFGTTFNIKIPITLTIFSSVIFGCGGLKMAIPQAEVSEIIRVSKRYNQTIEYVNASPVLRCKNELLPLIMLHDYFNEPATDDEIFVICICLEGFKFGLVVDKIFDIQEVVVKPLAKILSKEKIFAGSAVLGDGSLTLILDLKTLAKNVFGDFSNVAREASNGNFDHQDAQSHKTSLLIFKIDQLIKAVPLHMVKRITEVNLLEIIKVGEQYVYSELNVVIPVMVGKGMVDIDFTKPIKLPMIIISDNKRQLGIIVSEIIDIIEDNLDIDTATFEEDSLGTCMLQNNYTGIINATYYLNTAYPDWFRGY